MPELWVVHEFHRLIAIGQMPKSYIIYFNPKTFRMGKQKKNISEHDEVQDCIIYDEGFEKIFKEVCHKFIYIFLFYRNFWTYQLIICFHETLSVSVTLNQHFTISK